MQVLSYRAVMPVYPSSYARDVGYRASHSVSQAHPALLSQIAQIDSIQQKVDSGAPAVAALQVAIRHEQVNRRSEDNTQATAASIAALSTTMLPASRTLIRSPVLIYYSRSYYLTSPHSPVWFHSRAFKATVAYFAPSHPDLRALISTFSPDR